MSPAPQGEIDAIALPAHLASTCSLGQLQDIAQGYRGREHVKELVTFPPIGPVARRAPSVTGDRCERKSMFVFRTWLFSIANGRHQTSNDQDTG